MRPHLRIIVAYGRYEVGDVLTEVSGVDYDWLVDQGFCEPVKREEGEDVETATVGPTECAATRVAPKVVKRRRRKVKAK